jgi:membrane dipeptidase
MDDHDPDDGSPARSALAIDAHADTAQRILDLDERFDDAASAAEVSLAKARKGGLGAQFFSVWVDPAVFDGGAPGRGRAGWCDAVLAEVARCPRRAGAGPHRRRRARACRPRRLRRPLGVEGAHALGADGEDLGPRLTRLEELAADGVRYLSPTWSNSNDLRRLLGRRRPGPRPLGGRRGARRALRRARHPRRRVARRPTPTFDDLYAWASSTGRPLIASHSSARALANHPRNLTDAQLRAIADSGGVASVNFCPAFLDERFRAEVTAATATAEAAHGARRGAPAHIRIPVAPRSSPGRRAPPSPAPCPRRDRRASSTHVVHMVDVAGAITSGSARTSTASPRSRGLEDVSHCRASPRGSHRAG